MRTLEADYVVVGAGSAGCVLANRLSADPGNRVVLLEAGGRDINPWIHIPVGYFKTMARRLTVSRNTVMLAYQALAADGFLVARERSGFYVAEDAGAGLAEAPAEEASTPAPSKPVDWRNKLRLHPSTQSNISKPSNWHDYPYPFLYGQVDPTLFPIGAWRDCMRDINSLWSDKYKGRIAVYDYYIPLMNLVALKMGIKPSEITADILPQMREELFKLKDNSVMVGDVVASSTALAVGEADILIGGGEWAVSVLSAEQPELDWVLPDQGGMMPLAAMLSGR